MAQPLSETEALLELLYLTPVGLIKFRPGGEIELANPVAAQLLMPLAPESDLSDLYRVLSAVVPHLRTRVDNFGAPSGVICEQIQVAVAGFGTVLSLTVSKINQETLLAVVQDITRKVLQERRIREDEQRFRTIFENICDHAIYTVDLAGRIDTWNRSLARCGGWGPSDVIGCPAGLFFQKDPASQAESVSLLERARHHGKAAAEGWRVRKDGSRFWGESVASTLPDEFGGVAGYVLVTRNLTERKQMEDRLIELSVTDPMTGALNRRAGETHLEAAFPSWLHNGAIFSVLMIDCDHFKSINDNWGHDAGDEVLIAMVRICRSHLRSADTIFRWGGEEFLVLLPNTNGETALTVAERLRLALAAAEIASTDSRIRFTVSVGAAEVSAADTSPDDAVRRADRALYRAKAAGRNRVVLD